MNLDMDTFRRDQDTMVLYYNTTHAKILHGATASSKTHTNKPINCINTKVADNACAAEFHIDLTWTPYTTGGAGCGPWGGHTTGWGHGVEQRRTSL